MAQINHSQVVTHSGDTTRVSYTMIFQGKAEEVSVGFVGSDGSLRVYYIGFPDRQ
jgi:hypothetical protein